MADNSFDTMQPKMMVENVEDIEKNKDKSYNSDDAVELAGHGSYNYLCLFTCCIITLAVALDMFAFGIIVATSSCDLQLTMQQKGILSSIPFSSLFFAFVWGYFADTGGRKKAIICSTSVGFVFCSLTSLASEWYIMLICKFIGCSFSTASFSLTMTYLGESTSSAHRSRYLQLMNCVNLASEFVTFILAFLIFQLDFSIPLPWIDITYRPWRLLSFIMTLPMGIGAVMMVFLHESPKFLAGQGKLEEALDVVKRIYVTNGGKAEEYPIKSLSSEKLEEKSDANFWSTMWRTTTPIFKPPLLLRTLQLFYLVIVICSTNNAFVMWFPVIVNTFFNTLSKDDDQTRSFCERINDNSTSYEEGMMLTQPCVDTLSDNTILCGIIYGVFFTSINLLVSGTKRRKLVVILVFLLSAVNCILLVTVHQPIANLVFFMLIQVTSVCLGITSSYFVDLFPTFCRGLVTSLGMMAARFGSFAAINLIGSVITDYCEITFYCWAVFVISGIVVASLLP